MSVDEASTAPFPADSAGAATPGAGASPAVEYARRLQARRVEESYLAARDGWFALGRLGVFGSGGAVVWAATRGHLSVVWVLLPLVLFVGLVELHQRNRRAQRRAGRAAAFYERGLRRLEDRWAGDGVTGERYLDPAHPYAIDLDLFGPGSLFELLCSARTSAGERCLADWLLAAAPPDEIRARQAAVAELRERLDLREDLAVLGEEVKGVLEGEALAAWGAAPRQLTAPALRWVARVLALCGALSLAAWGLGYSGAFFGVVLVIELLFLRAVLGRVQPVVQDVDRRSRDLTLLSTLLERLEAERFESPRLRTLRAGLDREGLPPSRRIARLRRLVELLESERNQLFAPIAIVLLWRVQLALALERWRAENGPDIAVWLASIGELEALSGLAAHAWERPEDPFAEIVEGAPCFEGEGIAHPLLPGAAVRNNLQLGSAQRLLLVSGSNMSGKSTLMRTVGVNTVLALAGAPVRARRLKLTPLAIGASIRVQDSLQGGVSRFYAEISRIRQVVGLADGALPLLFLLDEILHGTNSHDRRIGAEAIMRTLVRKGAIGLVTTHDLALARIAEDPALHTVNVHFEDRLEAGRMFFDYTLRPGVVEKSNAIALMRAVGLEV